MNSNTRPDRDPFSFSLRGIRAVNSHAIVPAVADGGIHSSQGARPACRHAPAQDDRRSVVARQVEAVLARYFAHGCCTSA